ncbi:MAG: DUF2854 domain-containing protein [Cyanobacteria bacterium P01_A01_bin.84]
MLRRISLGTLGLSVGTVLTLIGFIAYAVDYATLNLAGFFYGIPLLLGGLALKTSELKPVPFSTPTSPSVLELRKQKATSTQNKIREDITRFRYGQDIHLDTSLSHLGLGASEDEYPIVVGLRETDLDGHYCMILEFESPDISIDVWEAKKEKMTKFFGPGVEVKVTEIEENKIELALTTTSTSAVATK